jgi:Mce-associated membrane protein
MKLKPGAGIESDGAKVGGRVDIAKREFDSDTAAEDEVEGNPNGMTTGSPGEGPNRHGLSAKLLVVPRTIAATTARTLRHSKSLIRRGVGALVARWRLVTLTVAVVAAIALASASFFSQYRPNQQTNDSAVHAVIKAASDGTVALLSYSPETIDNDVAAGKSHLTGELLKYFSGFTQYFVTPAVRQQGIKATAAVLRAAAADMHPNSAVVLIFVHQTTTTKDKPDPVLSVNSVRVTLTKVNGSWLIAKFEPE